MQIYLGGGRDLMSILIVYRDAIPAALTLFTALAYKLYYKSSRKTFENNYAGDVECQQLIPEIKQLVLSLIKG